MYTWCLNIRITPMTATSPMNSRWTGCLVTSHPEGEYLGKLDIWDQVSLH